MGWAVGVQKGAAGAGGGGTRRTHLTLKLKTAAVKNFLKNLGAAAGPGKDAGQSGFRVGSAQVQSSSAANEATSERSHDVSVTCPKQR